MACAVAVLPAFTLNKENARAIIDICRQLDGIPLAIELAASRARAMSAEDIAARLNDRFRLLTSGNRTALPRQQTLRALIDWSYDLLSDSERIVLRHLSVFAAGWALNAAGAVCAGRDFDEASVLDALTQLVEKSLVTFSPVNGRYSLLETVRQYAYERLTASGEANQAHTRHLIYCVELVERVEPKLRGPEQGAWLAQLDLERENLLLAHAWCNRAEGGAAMGLRLVHSAEMYWPNRGEVQLGHRLTVEALHRRGANERTVHRCRALIVAGQQADFLGRYRQAREYLEESQSIAREIGNQERLGVALVLLGRVSLAQADRAAARRYLMESLALVRSSGNKRAIAGALDSLAAVHEGEGDVQAAVVLQEQSVTLSREEGDHLNVAIGLITLARLSIESRSINRAREMLREAVVITADISSQWAVPLLLNGCAELSALLGEWPRTARFIGALEAQLELTGLSHDALEEGSDSRLKARAQEALGETAFASAETAGHDLSLDMVIAEMRAWL